jgi:hypothetical protein
LASSPNEEGGAATAVYKAKHYYPYWPIHTLIHTLTCQSHSSIHFPSSKKLCVRWSIHNWCDSIWLNASCYTRSNQMLLLFSFGLDGLTCVHTSTQSLKARCLNSPKSSSIWSTLISKKTLWKRLTCVLWVVVPPQGDRRIDYIPVAHI